MRLAVVNKCFNEEFRNETNIKVNDIEKSLEDKIKKLTETKHYNELKFDRQELKFEGPIYCNNSWCYCNLVCLDFIIDKDLNAYRCNNNNQAKLPDNCGGLNRTLYHSLNLETTLVVNTYSPELGMAKLDIWAVFHKNGIMNLSPTFDYHCIGPAGLCICRSGWSNYIQVNCLIVL